MDELKNDFCAMKVPMPKVTEHRVMPQSISALQDQMCSGETHLDVEVIGSICPGGNEARSAAGKVRLGFVND